jgi:SH3 domain protein
MKSIVFSLLLLFILSTNGYGETKYVTDSFPVMVRTGPNLTHKIIAMPKSGAAIEIVEVPDEQRVEEWVKVRIGGEKEGWMLSQFLVPGPPKHQIIARLEKENAFLKNRTKKLSEENAQNKKERRELEKALSTKTKTGANLREEYESLKRESKDFLALKASHQEASRGLEVKTKQVEELEKELEGLQRSQTLRWFIAGASIILVGFIIGYISRRPKRRPSLL